MNSGKGRFIFFEGVLFYLRLVMDRWYGSVVLRVLQPHPIPRRFKSCCIKQVRSNPSEVFPLFLLLPTISEADAEIRYFIAAVGEVFRNTPSSLAAEHPREIGSILTTCLNGSLSHKV